MTQTTVKLLSHTAYPVETIYCLWEASRQPEPFPLAPEDLAELFRLGCRADEREGRTRRFTYLLTPVRFYLERKGSLRAEADPLPVLRREVEETFAGVVHGNIPVAENISLTFFLDHVPVSLREQMVRHRIGHHFGERLGCDIVPDLSDSTWWSQTMRAIDMSNFADQGHYFAPPRAQERLALEDSVAYHEHIRRSQATYRQLLAAGWPEEEARNVLPLATTHSISWTTNLSALRHIVGKRGCWIAQLGIWEPVIRGMVEEVALKIHPLLRSLIDPPCIQRGRWVGCSIGPDNLGRLRGRDAKLGGEPCSLYLHHHTQEAREALAADPGDPNRAWSFNEDKGWRAPSIAAAENYERMQRKFGALWQRDPKTGEPQQ